MAKKAATIENLKVRVNKDGTLSKKSLEDIRGLVKPGVGERMASRVDIHSVVEGAGFAGLVGMYWMGFDPLSQIMGKAGVLIGDVIEDEDTMISILASSIALPLTGIAGALATLAVALSIGMEKDAVEKTVKRTAVEEAAYLKRKIAGIEGQIRLIERGGLGLAIPDPDRPGRFIPAPAEQTRIHLEKEKERLEDEKQRAIAVMNELIRKLFVLRASWSFGMAYVSKKFLESYNYFRAVENIPLVE